MHNYKINSKFTDIVEFDTFLKLMKNIKLIAFRNTIKFQEYLPHAASDNGIYRYSDTFYDSWHGGWWIGIFYNAYEAFGDERFRHYAENIGSRLYSLIKNNRIVHREMGFIYLPVCVPDMKINKNSEAVESAILAAEYMMESFEPVDEIDGIEPINRIFSGYTDARSSELINSEILRLAAGISGNSKMNDVAKICDENSLKHNVTPEGKCYMLTRRNSKNGDYIPMFDDPAGYGFEKYGDYIRPYAWFAIGLGIKYAVKKDEKYEQYLYRIINYFLKVSDGNLSMFVPGDKEGRKITDTTSLAIFVCAFSEILKVMDTNHPHYGFYHKLLKKWFNVMISYAIDEGSGKQGFLDSGVHLDGVTIDGGKINNSSNICGDYFYFEALMHMIDGFESCWCGDRFFKNKEVSL